MVKAIDTTAILCDAIHCRFSMHAISIGSVSDLSFSLVRKILHEFRYLVLQHLELAKCLELVLLVQITDTTGICE